MSDVPKTPYEEAVQRRETIRQTPKGEKKDVMKQLHQLISKADYLIAEVAKPVDENDRR